MARDWPVRRRSARYLGENVRWAALTSWTRRGRRTTERGPDVAVKFDQTLFDELVLYIAWRMRDDPRFGRVKFAKTMFYADFTHYEELGEPLTGASYYRYPKGPLPVEIYRAEERLETAGLATLKKAQFKYDEEKLMALSFEPSRTTSFHRAYLDLKMDRVAEEKTAKAVSDKSHEHPGWRVTGHRQKIPYRTVYVSRDGPTADDVAAADNVLRELWA